MSAHKFKDRRRGPPTFEIANAEAVEMSSDDYHSPKTEDSMSHSELVAFKKDPMAFWKKKFEHHDPGAKSDDLRIGRVIHQMVLETTDDWHRVPTEALSKNGSRAGGAWKEWLAEHGHYYVLPKEYELVKRWADAIEAHPIWREYITRPNKWIPDLEHEKTITGEHAPTGVKTRVRLDVFSSLLCDLKSAQRLDPYAFSKHADDFGYNSQGAFYQDHVRALTGENTYRDMLWFVFKKTSHPDEPVNIECYEFEEEFLHIGRRLNYRRLDLFAAFWEWQQEKIAAGEKITEEDWRPLTYGSVTTLKTPMSAMYREDWEPDPNDYVKKAVALRKLTPGKKSTDA